MLRVVAVSVASLAAITLITRWRRSQEAVHARWVRAVGFRSFAAEVEVAVELALQCGAAMRKMSSAQATLKDGGGERAGIDPVTATDEANENLVTQTLARRFPAHEIIGEEAAAALGRVPPIPQKTPTWIVDPIDGTQNFVHGLPLSVVSIGLCVDGEPTLGVVYDPYLDELFVGIADEGAYLNGRRLQVDGCTTLETAMVLTDVGYERSAEGVRKMSAGFSSLLEANTFAVRLIGSSVLALTWVAAGRASAFYAGFGKKDCPKPWDWCAACAIGKACGVTFRRLESDAPFDITSSSCIVASTPELAGALAQVLRKHLRAVVQK